MLCSLLLSRLNVRFMSRIVMLGSVVIYYVLSSMLWFDVIMKFYLGFGGCVLRLRKLRFVMVRMMLVMLSVVCMIIDDMYSGMM